MLWMALRMILCVTKSLRANSTESKSANEEDTEDAEDPTDSDVDDLEPFDDIEDQLIMYLYSASFMLS